MKATATLLTSYVFFLILFITGCSDEKESSIHRFRTVELNDNRDIVAMVGLRPKLVYSKDSLETLLDKKIIEFFLMREGIVYSVDDAGDIYFKPNMKRNPYESDMDFMWKKTEEMKTLKINELRTHTPTFSCATDQETQKKLQGVLLYETRVVNDSVIFFRDDLGVIVETDSTFHPYTESDEDIQRLYKYVDYAAVEGKCLDKKTLVLKFRFYQALPANLIEKVKTYALAKNVSVDIVNMKKGFLN